MSFVGWNMFWLVKVFLTVICLKTLTDVISRVTTQHIDCITKHVSRWQVWKTCFCTESLYCITCCDSHKYLSYIVIQSAKIILPTIIYICYSSYYILHASCHNLPNRLYLKVRHFFILSDVQCRGFHKPSPLTQTDAFPSFYWSACKQSMDRL